MQIQIKVNASKTTAMLTGVNFSLRDQSGLMGKIESALVRYTKQRVRTEGFGAWKKLAPSTIQKTGRTKALQDIIPYIKGRSGAKSAAVYFSGKPAGWSLAMHEKGFKSPAVKDTGMAYKHADGTRVGFKRKRKSVIPARRVFPNEGESMQIVMPLANEWLTTIIRRKSK